MPNKKTSKTMPGSRWMTECDVIRYNLRIPENLKNQLKKESSQNEMDMSSYICALISGEIKRKKTKK